MVELKKAKIEKNALSVNLKQCRERVGITLEQLADRSGVSKAMLSKIENGKAQPTIVSLGKIAEALDVSITKLVGYKEQRRILVMSRRDQPVITDSKAGYIRRSLSPLFPSRGVDFVEGHLKKGASTGLFGPHPDDVEEMLVVAKGRLQVNLEGETFLLSEGDSIYFQADMHHQFDNVGAEEAIFYLVINGSRHS